MAHGKRKTKRERAKDIVLFGGLLIMMMAMVSGDVDNDEAYAEVFVHNDSDDGYEQVISSANNWTNITIDQGSESGVLKFRVDQVDNAFVIQLPGYYKVDYSVSFAGGANDEYKLSMTINDVEQEKLEIHRKLGAGGDVGNAGGTGILRLDTGDAVYLQIINEDSAANANIHGLNWNIQRIGGWR